MRFIEDDGRDFDTICAEFRWRIPQRYNMAVDACDRHRDRLDQVALFLEDADGAQSRHTYRELKALSDRLANVLRGLGVGRGDRVGIVLSQRLETVLAHLAIYKLGAVALPLSVLFGRDAISFRLADSGARAVIAGRDHLDLLLAMQADLEHLEHVLCADRGGGEHDLWSMMERAAADIEPVDTLADDPALLIYTSGTTGPPKGALNAQRCLLGNLPAFEMSYDFFPREGDVMWTPADWAWTGGLLDALLPALRYGVPVVGYRGGRFDPERACRVMAEFGVSTAFIPPTAMKMIMQVPGIRERHRLRLRAIMSAGEQVGAEVLRWTTEELGVSLNEMWGQTEFNYLAGGCAAVLPARPGAMGKPYPGRTVDVVDERGRPLPAGEVGELAARTGNPVMFLGYWNNEQATREKILAGWWRTGDSGIRDEDGYLWFVGRRDDVISSAGHRIGPGEVEDSLLKHPAVAQAAVIGVPDPLRGEIVKAFVVLAQGHAPSARLVEDIQASVKERLAAHEYPRAIEFVDDLPMTTTGKVRRVELRRRERERAGDGG